MISDACDQHRERFGSRGIIAAVAPGRVNLIGEHVDYAGGLVLPVAINRYTVVVASEAASSKYACQTRVPGVNGPVWRFSVIDAGMILSPSVAKMILKPSTRYPIVAAMLNHVPETFGCNLTITSNLPMGAGLSSSASVLVAVRGASAALFNLTHSRERIAQLAYEVERQVLKIPCGIMDQFVVACARAGSAFLLDCADGRRWHIHWPGHRLGLVVIDTRTRHAVADGTYARLVSAVAQAQQTLGGGLLSHASEEDVERVWPALNDASRRAATHVLGENARVMAMLQELRSERPDEAVISRCMAGSHASLRDGLGVSCPELDAVVDRASGVPGVVGARLTGAGFGGSVVVIVHAGEEQRVIEALTAPYPHLPDLKPEGLAVRPSRGVVRVAQECLR